MTEQEIFDTVANHLLTQGRKAWDHGSCKYRAPNGDKCAVGCLIPDEEYDPVMEGVSANGILNVIKIESLNAPITESLIMSHGLLLQELQELHDFSHSLKGNVWKDVNSLKCQLSRVANKFNLRFNYE